MTKLALKTINKCQYITCMNPKAGSDVVDPRLQRWMTCFAIGLPSVESLTTIYETFMMGHFSEDHKFPGE